jgi:hypothetical protein
MARILFPVWTPGLGGAKDPTDMNNTIWAGARPRRSEETEGAPLGFGRPALLRHSVLLAGR